MTPQQKAKETIVKKYGSYEAYLELRYRTPKARENAAKAGRIGGKVKVGSFNDTELAKRAAKLSVEARKRNKEQQN